MGLCLPVWVVENSRFLRQFYGLEHDPPFCVPGKNKTLETKLAQHFIVFEEDGETKYQKGYPSAKDSNYSAIILNVILSFILSQFWPSSA